jgi:predicted phage tail protein
LITVQLIGTLGDRFGSNWNLDIATPSEAIRAIAYQIPEFAAYINSHDYYQVLIDGQQIDVEGLDYRIKSDLVIAPAMVASGAAARIITGVALLGASFFMPAALLGISSLTIGLFGASMIAGGIVDLLSPQPDPERSNANLIAQSEAVQGRSVPVLFGTRYIKPPVISSWLDTIDETN